MKIEPEWEYVSDTVMGGVSEGGMQQEMYRGRMATVLRGAVSLENNGGFVQIAFDLRPDGTGFNASDWDGIELINCGNHELYDIRLRTDQLSRPWQSFRTDFTAASEWRTERIPFAAFVSHKTDAIFDPSQLRRIGVLAIGRAFQAELAVAGICLYRD
ncbi:CIA30 family protein [Pararhizobium sp. IMCC21322]|uniref:CIA30 family protein n=1 Tax=Pararhizobium sp. IMCC21322 TaxID=3067903 RepID=UPI002740E865|nr:CIA30 family protein [Pararhizobium sp. IMCC21322]